MRGYGGQVQLRFDWDPNKAKSNWRKHGVTFDEARTVFADFGSGTMPDPLHSEVEDRAVTVGRSDADRVLVVVHTDEGDTIRIISARSATKRERHDYAEL